MLQYKTPYVLRSQQPLNHHHSVYK